MPVLSLIGLLAIRLGCQRTPAKSLVMSKRPATKKLAGMARSYKFSAFH
jgi:xanthosine utilization system XapX-like protein